MRYSARVLSAAEQINDFMQEWNFYLRHLPTCAADQFLGQACNCGLRTWVATLLPVSHDGPHTRDAPKKEEPHA